MVAEEPLLLNDRSCERELLVRHDPDARGLIVRRSVTAELTSRHVARLSVESVARPGGVEERFTQGVPKADPAALERLDPGGVIAEGAVVRPGDVLVGRVQERVSPAGTDDPNVEVRDISLRCPPNVKGTVTSIARNGKRVEVEITDERPLRVGDVLEIAGRHAVVSAIVDRQAAQIVWAGEAVGRTTVRKVACAEDRLQARSIGPYSLVTQQPLGGKASFGGQLLTEAQLYALEARGAWHTLREMLTVKSDDVQGRVRLYETIVKGEPRCEASVPESARVLLRELEALAFDVTSEKVEREAGAPAGDERDIFSYFERPQELALGVVRISLCASECIRARSKGRVKKPETINYRTFAPEPEGLFCDRIFGPVRDYRCRCGRYRTMRDRGTVCEECGVEVVHSKVRRERFGHVQLPALLLHPWAFDAVAALLERPVDDIERIAHEHLTLDLEEPEDWRLAGCRALHDAVAAVDLGEAEQGSMAAVMHRSGTDPTRLFFDVWPVLPPDLRPLVPLDGGRFATSDLNDLYRRLINRANRLSRLIELDAPPLILRNEHRMLQEALECLVQNGLRGRLLTGPDARPLRSLADLLGGPAGHLCAGQRGKRVDFSGAATVVPVELPARKVLLPRSMALELFRPWIYSRLEEKGEVTTIKEAKRLVEAEAPAALLALDEVIRDHPVVVFPSRGDAPPPTVVAGFDVGLWDELALGMSPLAMERFGLDAGGDAVEVHVPADPESIREARGLDLPAAALRAFDDGFHHRLLRHLVVHVADCGCAVRGIASCQALGAPCAACSGRPVGTPIGLLAADGLDAAEIDPDHDAVLQRQPAPPGWLRRAALADDIGPVLLGAALAREVDPVADPMTRALLGHLGWEPGTECKEGRRQ
jgi:hypothetical protein